MHKNEVFIKTIHTLLIDELSKAMDRQFGFP